MTERTDPDLTRFSWRWLMLPVGLLPLLTALAQDPAPDEATEATEAAEESAEAVVEDQAPGDNAGAETDEALDPLAGESGADAFEDMDAKLDRFDPSEQISEDRAVSFPNDI